jgi:hypothetical protein
MSAVVSPRQFVLLNWCVAVLVVGVLLPLGMVAIFLEASSGSIGTTVEHGELFLVSGNATVTASTVLLATRLDQLLDAVIASFCAILLIAVPSYGIWAYMTTQSLLGGSYNLDFAVKGGWIMLAVGLTTSFAFVATAAQEQRNQITALAREVNA